MPSPTRSTSSASSGSLAEGGRALAADDPETAAGLLREALQLWRGPALAEFAPEPFANIEGGRLDDLRVAALEERIRADLALGRHADLIGELEVLIAEHPHREPLTEQLMLALYRSGRQTEALAAYRRLRATLDELGLEPGERLQVLERQILNHDPEIDAPARAHPPAPAGTELAPPAPRRAAGRAQVGDHSLRRAGDDERGGGGSRTDGRAVRSSPRRGRGRDRGRRRHGREGSRRRPARHVRSGGREQAETMRGALRARRSRHAGGSRTSSARRSWFGWGSRAATSSSGDRERP